MTPDSKALLHSFWLSLLRFLPLPLLLHQIIANFLNDQCAAQAKVRPDHNLCLDKKDIITAEIEACNRLSKYTRDEKDKKVIDREIAELKMSLDLIN